MVSTTSNLLCIFLFHLHFGCDQLVMQCPSFSSNIKLKHEEQFFRTLEGPSILLSRMKFILVFESHRFKRSAYEPIRSTRFENEVDESGLHSEDRRRDRIRIEWRQAQVNEIRKRKWNVSDLDFERSYTHGTMWCRGFVNEWS